MQRKAGKGEFPGFQRGFQVRLQTPCGLGRNLVLHRDVQGQRVRILPRQQAVETLRQFNQEQRGRAFVTLPHLTADSLLNELVSDK